MSFKFVYDAPYVKEIVSFVFIPILLIIVLSIIYLLYYNKKVKDHNDPKYKYNMNLYTLIITMLLAAVFLSMLIGFSLALKEEMDRLDFDSLVCYLVLISPVLPALFLSYLTIKLVKLVKTKPYDMNVFKNHEELESMLDITENPNITSMEDFKVQKDDHKEEKNEEEEEIELL